MFHKIWDNNRKYDILFVFPFHEFQSKQIANQLHINLEGYPRMYDRKLMDFPLPDGTTVQAWIYIMNELPHQAKVIQSEDWKKR